MGERCLGRAVASMWRGHSDDRVEPGQGSQDPPRDGYGGVETLHGYNDGRGAPISLLFPGNEDFSRRGPDRDHVLSDPGVNSC
jgi:hypothetical protein